MSVYQKVNYQPSFDLDSLVLVPVYCKQLRPMNRQLCLQTGTIDMNQIGVLEGVVCSMHLGHCSLTQSDSNFLDMLLYNNLILLAYLFN